MLFERMRKRLATLRREGNFTRDSAISLKRLWPRETI
jgi:hypothetical protein